MGSLEANVPLAVEGCHGAEASGLGRLAVGPAAPPGVVGEGIRAGRLEGRGAVRGPCRKENLQGRAAVQGSWLQRRRRLHPLSRRCTWLAQHVGLRGRQGL
jgi:hypothetical protein